MDKHVVARVLEDIGILLQVKGENPFKIRAYQNAARAIENLDEDLEVVVKEKRLTDLPGIGEKISKKITTLVKTGKLPYYEKLKKSVPESLLAMMHVGGLGGKKIKTLYEKLKIETVEELLKACYEGRVAKLRGFGEKTQSNIIRGFQKRESYEARFLWWKAMTLAEPILKGLLSLNAVEKAEVAGSLRRKLETIGDLDFLVSSKDPMSVMEWFTKQKKAVRILAQGLSKSSIRLKQGLQADLRVVTPKEYPFALVYFTGSKEHNIKLRHLANELGLTLSEYALEPLKKNRKAKPLPKIKTEEDLYQALGLSYIEPEMREDRGEIEAAKKGKLPKLVEEKDIRGCFHCHTTESDGHNTLEEMVMQAQNMRWDYIGVSDHSKSSFQANGMDEERLFSQLKRIQKLNSSKKFSIHVFAGIECDILKDGKMDFPDEILKELDFVIASVHSSFKLNEEEMTKRIIKAIENPFTTILGHATGRLLLRRDPYLLNLPKVIDACIANGKWMELNAHPMRLDMDWRFWIKAKEKGLKCCIGPDAHSISDLEFYKMGVAIARKGWLEKEDILNTLPLSKIKAHFSFF